MSLHDDRKQILYEVYHKTSNEENLLGVLIDKNLSFDIHIKSLCRNSGQKISVLARSHNYLTNAQNILLINSLSLVTVLCCGCFVVISL